MKKFLFFILIIGLLLPGEIFALEANPEVSVAPSLLIAFANEERGAQNIGLLRENELLSKAAQLKANDMAARGYFSHTTPEGKLPWYFMDQVGYRYSHAGENLAVNFFDSREVADAWMKSPTHRENIMKKGFTQVGIGVASGTFQGKTTIFVAEFFGTPVTPIKANLKPKIKVTKTRNKLPRKLVAY